MPHVIKMKRVTKTYRMGDMSVQALRGIDLEVERGEFLAIMGPSGSGKSTLMNLLGCLDKPTSGEYFLDDVNVSGLSKNEYAGIRNEKIGFVFQTYNLLPRTSALENVELPLFYDRTGRIKNPKQAAVEALARVGLGDRLHHEPSQLSGGEQQRVAIARALVNQPAIVLADEPTGNLDTRVSIDVMSVFQELNQEGITVVLVTHEPDIAVYTNRIVKIRDGIIRQSTAVLKPGNAKKDLEAYRDPVEDELEKAGQ
ncbi:macrolide export ATP-binding/permease protein MacB [bacterium BMS3Abin05]|nr:macrolide export ATP-binding/permease protein MacB [bacterium BMS3Abin05]GBE28357.1 macrolide export ATP-binding/permease protein MacB [bacterium BMS3Bbin03]HDZ12277.1 ABC transporter ATP-binding protein [Bacteroidota bacterium]